MTEQQELKHSVSSKVYSNFELLKSLSIKCHNNSMKLDNLTDPHEIDKLGTQLSIAGDHIGALECFQKSNAIRANNRLRGSKRNDIQKPTTPIAQTEKVAPIKNSEHSELYLHVVITPAHKIQIRKLAQDYEKSNPRKNGSSQLYQELLFTVHKIANLPKIKIISNPVVHTCNLVEDLLKQGTFSAPADYNPGIQGK